MASLENFSSHIKLRLCHWLAGPAWRTLHLSLLFFSDHCSLLDPFWIVLLSCAFVSLLLPILGHTPATAVSCSISMSSAASNCTTWLKMGPLGGKLRPPTESLKMAQAGWNQQLHSTKIRAQVSCCSLFYHPPWYQHPHIALESLQGPTMGPHFLLVSRSEWEKRDLFQQPQHRNPSLQPNLGGANTFNLVQQESVEDDDVPIPEPISSQSRSGWKVSQIRAQSSQLGFLQCGCPPSGH